MLAFLRFVGILNAAIWLGALVFASFVVLPVFFSPEVTPGLVHRYYSGRIAAIVLHRVFVMQLICGIVAIIHFAAEHLYAGKVLPRFAVSSVVVITLLTAAGGFILQPKMDRWHLIKYASNTLPAQRAEAARKFGIWHGVSQVTNILILTGVFIHFVRQANTPAPTKFSRGARAP